MINDIKVTNSATFQMALQTGNLEAADTWLQLIRLNRDQFPQYDNHWLDRRESELFHAACNERQWQIAKRLVAVSTNKFSNESRVTRLEELTGLPLWQI